MAWTTPRTWATLEQVTATYLNQQLRDNMDYLFRRPRATVTLQNGTNFSVSSTSITAVDDNVFTLQVETTGGDVDVEFQSSIVATASLAYRFDILLDGTTYASSGTGTNLALGVANAATTTTGVINFLRFKVRFTGLAAGIHTFKLRAWVSTSTLTITSVNSFIQFSAIEI